MKSIRSRNFELQTFELELQRKHRTSFFFSHDDAKAFASRIFDVSDGDWGDRLTLISLFVMSICSLFHRREKKEEEEEEMAKLIERGGPDVFVPCCPSTGGERERGKKGCHLHAVDFTGKEAISVVGMTVALCVRSFDSFPDRTSN